MKEFTVFYAWQSDTPRKLNKNFIYEALRSALSRISADPTIEDSPRIDHDTKDVAGIPEIASTILQKIDICGVFVADLTIVGQTPERDGKVKLVPNPNVMLELGYALKAVGSEAIICIMNEAFGSVDAQVFDLAHRRWPITYKLDDHKDPKYKKVQEDLSHKIEGALRIIIAQGIPDRRDPTIIRDESIRRYFRSAIYKFLSMFRFVIYNDAAFQKFGREVVELFSLDTSLMNGGGVDYKRIEHGVIGMILENRDLSRDGKIIFNDDDNVISVGESLVLLVKNLEKECDVIMRNYAATGNPHLIEEIQVVSNKAHGAAFYGDLRFLEFPDGFCSSLEELFQEIRKVN